MQTTRTVIATNGIENMTLEQFLQWELNGGKGTYESDLSQDAPSWDELPIEDKIAYMANSIAGDMLSDNWTLIVVPQRPSTTNSHWFKIRNNHTDTACQENGDAKIIVSIDAWTDMNDNTPGEVIARVIKTKHNDIFIDYINTLAIHDSYAQTVIQKTVDQLKIEL